MTEEPDPADDAAAKKAAAEKANVAAKKKKLMEEMDKLETVDLNEKPSKAEDLISKANAAAARQEAANEKLEGLLKQQAEQKVEQTLGGETAAGGEPTVDENAGAKSLLQGTGYENMFDPPKDDPAKK